MTVPLLFVISSMWSTCSHRLRAFESLTNVSVIKLGVPLYLSWADTVTSMIQFLSDQVSTWWVLLVLYCSQSQKGVPTSVIACGVLQAGNEGRYCVRSVPEAARNSTF